MSVCLPDQVVFTSAMKLGLSKNFCRRLAVIRFLCKLPDGAGVTISIKDLIQSLNSDILMTDVTVKVYKV